VYFFPAPGRSQTTLQRWWALKFVNSQRPSCRGLAGTRQIERLSSASCYKKFFDSLLPHGIQIDPELYYDLTHFDYLQPWDGHANSWIM
jgi:hypothetical protein